MLRYHRLIFEQEHLVCCVLCRDTSVEIDDDEADVRNLRERRPNASNRVELLEMMDRTRAERRHWIKSKAPTITEILQKYPRFQDIDEAVSLLVSVRAINCLDV